jgi:hypothetical protein
VIFLMLTYIIIVGILFIGILFCIKLMGKYHKVYQVSCYTCKHQRQFDSLDKANNYIDLVENKPNCRPIITNLVSFD